MDQDAFMKLLLEEYAYWRKAPDAEAGQGIEMDLIAMGAMAAAANVIGALHGHPAPWHTSRLPAEQPAPAGGQS